MIYKKGDLFLDENKELFVISQLPGEVPSWLSCYILNSVKKLVTQSETIIVHQENILFYFTYLSPSCPAVQILYTSMVTGGSK